MALLCLWVPNSYSRNTHAPHTCTCTHALPHAACTHIQRSTCTSHAPRVHSHAGVTQALCRHLHARITHVCASPCHMHHTHTCPHVCTAHTSTHMHQKNAPYVCIADITHTYTRASFIHVHHMQVSHVQACSAHTHASNTCLLHTPTRAHMHDTHSPMPHVCTHAPHWRARASSTHTHSLTPCCCAQPHCLLADVPGSRHYLKRYLFDLLLIVCLHHLIPPSQPSPSTLIQ